MATVTYLEAVRQGMWDEMEKDSRVFLLGQDIGRYGGPFRVTAGFLDRFGPERILDTPISESAMVGCAIGAAMIASTKDRNTSPKKSRSSHKRPNRMTQMTTRRLR